ncbi:PE-PPE domain-containing protein [Mycobacterium sp. NAZ190054]|uniref:PE-PPE domain-containing protein n=1 Tax=Mycobacterium sp. NAZ190054 TaxID=1747766 RepID=UPI00079AA3D1|nr:PE-PPE domain-containing protein [Mycobacterium sp. NAZ190054]KWX68847.1 hypothetical protein ASJ79_16120 [Mycobacterium sp. NAZ190054]
MRQYDGLGGDFPVRPLNLVATLNSLLGYGLMHGETVDEPFRQARFQGRHGDTGYYLVETDLVPLLQPLTPLVPRAILKAIDAPLRVLIEDAYDRDVNPGVPTPVNWRPVTSVTRLAARLAMSIPVAVDNFTEEIGLGRVLGTDQPGTFGVGGPELPTGPAAEGDVEDVAPQSLSETAARHRDRAADDEPAEPEEPTAPADPQDEPLADEPEAEDPDEAELEETEPAQEQDPDAPSEAEDDTDEPADEDAADAA